MKLYVVKQNQLLSMILRYHKWFYAVRAKIILIGGPTYKEKTLQVSKKLVVGNFKQSNGWFDKFKARYNISFKVICGESKSVNTETIDAYKGV